jgi:hypothetical protein
MGPSEACIKAVDVAVEERGAGGGTIKLPAPVGKMKRSPRPVRVEAEAGSATSWDRPAEHSYLVRLCRGERAVVVAAGMSKAAAECLADRVRELLSTTCGSSRGLCTGEHQ